MKFAGFPLKTAALHIHALAVMAKSQLCDTKYLTDVIPHLRQVLGTEKNIWQMSSPGIEKIFFGWQPKIFG